MTKAKLPTGFELIEEEAAVPSGFELVTPTFGEQVTTSMRERGGQLADIVGATRRGEQTRAEGVLQTVGTEIGAVGDIAGAGIAAAGRKTKEVLPPAIKDPFSLVGKHLWQKETTKKALKSLEGGVDSYLDFKTKNPRSARNLEAVFNVATVTVPVKGGKSILGATTDVAKGVRKVTGKVPIITSDDLAKNSAAAYKEVSDIGANYSPKVRQKFINKIEGLRPGKERLVGGKNVFEDLLEKAKIRKNEPITLQGAQQIDEELGTLIDGEFGLKGLSSDGKKLQDLQIEFRNLMETSSVEDVLGDPAGFKKLKEARKLWGASRRMKDVEAILQKAEFSDNPATTIKRGFANIVSNPKKRRGYSKKELSLMSKAAKSGVVSDMLRTTLGSRLVPIIAAGSGTFGGATAASVGSIAARGVAERGAVGRAESVAREIARSALKKGK